MNPFSFIRDRIRKFVSSAFLDGLSDGLDVLEGRTQPPSDAPRSLFGVAAVNEAPPALPGPSPAPPEPSPTNDTGKKGRKAA